MGQSPSNQPDAHVSVCPPPCRFNCPSDTMSSQWCVFVSSLSLALLIGGLTDACTCGPQHPQTKFCSSDIVIRGRIVGMEYVNMDNQTDAPQWIRYEVKQTKPSCAQLQQWGKVAPALRVTAASPSSQGVSWQAALCMCLPEMFKGFERVADVHYIYTPHDGGVCGFEFNLSGPAKQAELVMAGLLTEDGRVMVSVCSFIQPWDKLSTGQKRGIMYTYKDNCDCRINPCHSVPCTLTSERECLWTDGLFSRGWDQVQAQQYACVHQGDAACGWAPQKPLRPDAGLRRAPQAQ
ncbi:TIMP4 inhibitor, partial [Atractosteus spatula]|nr:TIMP4 inhibitor [Atractosteus spatula]